MLTDEVEIKHDSNGNRKPYNRQGVYNRRF